MWTRRQPPSPLLGAPSWSCRASTRHFGDLHVLKDIDLTVGKGEVVVVLGPSGSGKSTLCRTITGWRRSSPARSASTASRCPRRARSWPPAGRRRDGLPVLQPLRPQDDPPERHAGPHEGPQAEEVGRGAASQGAAGAGRRRAPGGQVPRPALGRPAAARRDRPVAGHGSQGHALRRADLGARPGDDQRGPRRHDPAWPSPA